MHRQTRLLNTEELRMSDLEGRRVGIWGFGREGRAALTAISSRLRSARVRVYTPDPQKEVDEVARSSAEFVSGLDPVGLLRNCEVVIRSPGVSIHRPEIADLRDAGVILTTGTNLWFAERKDSVPVVVVTGTKGKTTTASLVTHLAREAGTNVQLAGNVGKALLSLIGERPPQLYVVELSSFQIADLMATPTVAIVLNLYREHMDWHLTEEQYYEDKLRIVGRSDEVVPVLNAQDARLRSLGVGKHRTRWFGNAHGTDIRDGYFVDRHATKLARRSDLPLSGAHNALNACAALEALAVVELDRGDIGAALRTFRPPPHRLEVVSRAQKRLWINDSISTTPESTIAAIRSFPDQHVTVIVGGFERQQDYGKLAAALVDRGDCVAVVALPETGARVIDSLTHVSCGSKVVAHMASDLGEAVLLASRLTPPGGVVLLSPAAPSFGVYRNFEQRGAHFRELVAEVVG